MIEQAIRDVLVADAGVTNLVGSRVHFVQAPQDVDNPYIVLTKISGVRDNAHDGATGLVHTRIQLSVFATTYYEAKQIVQAAQNVLQAYSGLMGTVQVDSCFYENETDTYETDTKLYHVTSDYVLWNEE